MLSFFRFWEGMNINILLNSNNFIWFSTESFLIECQVFRASISQPFVFRFFTSSLCNDYEAEERASYDKTVSKYVTEYNLNSIHSSH